jgi:hypothetical protein
MAEVKLVFRDDLGELVHQIHMLWDDAEAFSRQAQAKYKSKRIKIGQALLEAKRRVEAGDGGALSWWDWYNRHFARSRQDAHRLMTLAASEDPQAAEQADREYHRKAVQEHRERKKDGVVIYSKLQKKPALKVVESVTPPEPIATTRWRTMRSICSSA